MATHKPTRRKREYPDLAGQTFGRLTVIGLANTPDRQWLCRCSCGAEKTARAADLTAGKIVSCGCKRRDEPWRAIDFAGKRMGRLLVLKYLGTRGPNRWWQCRCDCGRELERPSYAFTSNKAQSCGCLCIDVTRKRSTKHGYAPRKRVSPEYKVWCGMIDRCENKSHRSYKDYGGRGIKICPRWRNDFAAFLADMGPRPSPNHEIDRKENDGDYEPGNCRWVVQIANARNKRSNHSVTVGGITLTIAEWCERTGMKPSTLSGRLQKGWTDEEAVLTPVGESRAGTRRDLHMGADVEDDGSR